MTELLMLGGERVGAAEGATTKIVEPATGEPAWEVAEAGPEDAGRAVGVAAHGGTCARPGPHAGILPDPRASGRARPPRGAERGEAHQRSACRDGPRCERVRVLG